MYELATDCVTFDHAYLKSGRDYYGDIPEGTTVETLKPILAQGVFKLLTEFLSFPKMDPSCRLLCKTKVNRRIYHKYHVSYKFLMRDWIEEDESLIHLMDFFENNFDDFEGKIQQIEKNNLLDDYFDEVLTMTNDMRIKMYLGDIPKDATLEDLKYFYAKALVEIEEKEQWGFNE
jgi:hypothetical protein